uniref:Uncharacterized protein n=1 Tax=Arion vulgaris TaxID=1028688 RepID=A0A0B7A0P8_9EUPU
MQNQGQHPGVTHHWNQIPERPNQVSFGDRMNVGDKELSDLLDFSAEIPSIPLKRSMWNAVIISLYNLR